MGEFSSAVLALVDESDHGDSIWKCLELQVVQVES